MLTLRYEGGGERVVHPHVLFRSAPGNVVLDGYQVAGDSSTPDALPDWRGFDLGRIDSAALSAHAFPVAPGYNPEAPKYAGGVLARV